MIEKLEDYQQRIQELYKDANLKAMALEDKYSRLKLGMEQEMKNEISSA